MCFLIENLSANGAHVCWAGDAVRCVAVGGGGGGRVERGGAVRRVRRRGQGAGHFVLLRRLDPGRRDHAQTLAVGPLLLLCPGHLREGQGGLQETRRPRPGLARTLNKSYIMSLTLHSLSANKVLATSLLFFTF
jgi:hypothetical protein